ncbi:RDD family protein [Bacillus sp. FJAT-27445]|uniref:RDD family protein n=1 Tax=Bacillus sp. FJAT-27445 TaxID=1679166 RepID=UPI000743BFEA|nr:RDD family protein [Bacillus sp. FJAT-27445]
MYCPNCNTLNDDAARFCSKCGEYFEKKGPVVCPDCGTEPKKGEEFCNICGYKFSGDKAPIPSTPSMNENGVTGTNGVNNNQDGYAHNYSTYGDTEGWKDSARFANFGERLVAVIIDSVVLGVFGSILGFVFGVVDDSGTISDILSFIIGIGYKAGMEGSSKGATLGKMAMGIRVVGTDGGRISYGRAIGRYFASILSALILLIGYFMALFTKEKRTLHDIIAGTYVVKR